MYSQINKSLYIGAIFLLLSLSVFVACNSGQEKKEEEMQEVSADNSFTTIEWKEYKESANATITNNLERIKELKQKINTSNTPNLDKLRQKRINELEDNNTALRGKIMEYKEDDVNIVLSQFIEDIQKQLDAIEIELKELAK